MLGCCGIHGCEDRCSHFVGGRYAVFPDWLSIAISVLWLVLLSNAINLIDGLNGLSSGISAIVLIFASIITFKKGIFTVGLDALILAGAVLGFLPYNFPEAKTFIVIVVLKRWVLYWHIVHCWYVQEYCWNYLFWFFATSLFACGRYAFCMV